MKPLYKWTAKGPIQIGEYWKSPWGVIKEYFN